VDRIVARFGNDLSGRHIALWGLAFKPDTDDLREAPSRVVVAELAARGARITAHDPEAMPAARQALAGTPGLQFADTPMQALEGADALVVVTEWKAYRSPDFERMRQLMRQPVIVDGRNLYEPAMVSEAGFEYLPIGRQAPQPSVGGSSALPLAA
jgi:UDPglucose 6-dehydrogenase